MLSSPFLVEARVKYDSLTRASVVLLGPQKMGHIEQVLAFVLLLSG